MFCRAGAGAALGRPRPDPASGADRPAAHAEALGALLARGRASTEAVELLEPTDIGAGPMVCTSPPARVESDNSRSGLRYVESNRQGSSRMGEVEHDGEETRSEPEPATAAIGEPLLSESARPQAVTGWADRVLGEVSKVFVGQTSWYAAS